MRLSKTEKDEIAKLYKCRRSAELNDLMNVLTIEKDKLIEPEVQRCHELDQEVKGIQGEIKDILKKNGFDTLDRQGCIHSHPTIDEFQLETSDKLMKLWSGDLSTL